MSSFQRFHNTTVDFLEFIASSIADLRQKKMTRYTEVQVNIARNILSAYPPNTLVDDFIEHNKYWEHVAARNEDFILTDVPEIYKNMRIDVNLLIEPFRAFKANPDNGVIIDEDIDNMWKYFEVMVKISCNYINNHRLKNNGKGYDGVDLDLMTKLFKFELVADK